MPQFDGFGQKILHRFWIFGLADFESSVDHGFLQYFSSLTHDANVTSRIHHLSYTSIGNRNHTLPRRQSSLSLSQAASARCDGKG